MGGISEVRVDTTKNRLYLKISGFFRQADVPDSMRRLEQALEDVKPGFDVVTDLSEFMPGAPGASDALAKGGMMIKEKGRRRGVRITGGLMAVSAVAEGGLRRGEHALRQIHGGGGVHPRQLGG